MIFCYSDEKIYDILIMAWQKKGEKGKTRKEKRRGEREREKTNTQVSILKAISA